ncbi:unnamed protein product [Callosobruchus maculatus]|uniref:THAP-type domain-containing protein n=1 Tax=Callosobruchus maculatus TaxID=64391 RepID=A0A653D901_CALMS|nr:unnamed protein product [Callosobruchus maculatus]
MEKVLVETKLGTKDLVDRRQMWIRLLKLGKKPSDHMRVCSLHFNETDFLQKERVKRRTLKRKAVPSRNLPKVSHDAGVGRSRTIRSRPEPNTKTETFALWGNDGREDLEDRQAAEGLLALLNSHKPTAVPLPGPSSRDIGVQVNTPKVLTLCELIDSDELRNFTGLSNTAILVAIVEQFEKHHSDKRVRRINVRQRIVLLFTKFKTSLTYVTLGSQFGITRDLAKTYIHELIPALANILKPHSFASKKRNIEEYANLF